MSGFSVVIIADDYSGFLDPVSDNIPVCLSPVGNIPVIDFMLDFLRASGAGDVYIISSNKFHDELMGHLDTTFGSHPDSVFRVTVVFKDELSNSAMALREAIEQLDITEQFVLIDGPALLSFDLQAVLTRHKTLEAAYDGKYILTEVLRVSGQTDQSRGLHDPTMIVRDVQTGFIKVYEMEHSIEAINLPIKSIMDNNCVFSTDLVPSNVYVCSLAFKDVIMEEFDRNSMYSLVRGVINDVIKGTIVGSHIIGRTERILPIDCLRTLMNASRSYMCGELYPFTPICPPGNSRRKVEKRTQTDVGCFYYIESDKSMPGDGGVQAKSVIIGPSIVGMKSAVRAKAIIKNSVIGSKCTIDGGAIIENSILMDGVHVHAGAEIRSSFILPNVDVGRNASVGPGTIVGCNVMIPNNYQAKGATYIITSNFTEHPSGSMSMETTSVETSTESSSTDVDINDSSAYYACTDDMNLPAPNVPVFSCPGTPRTNKTEQISPRESPLIINDLYERDSKLLKLHASIDFKDRKSAPRLEHVFSALVSIPQQTQGTTSSDPSSNPVSNGQSVKTPVECDEEGKKAHRIAQVFSGPPPLPEDAWDRLYKTVSAGFIQRASDNTFQEEIKHVLSDIVSLTELPLERQEQLKVDIQGVRLSNNMDHQDCYPVIILSALQLAQDEYSEDVAKLVQESVRLLNLLWPLMDCYIMPELRESEGYSIEFLYGILSFVSSKVLDNEWNDWTQYVSSMFLNLYMSETEVSCDYNTFILFFSEIEGASDEKEKAFYEICTQFKEWLMNSEEEEEEEEGEEEWEEGEEEEEGEDN